MPIVPGRLLFQTAYGTLSTFYVPSEELTSQPSTRKALILLNYSSAKYLMVRTIWLV